MNVSYRLQAHNNKTQILEKQIKQLCKRSMREFKANIKIGIATTKIYIPSIIAETDEEFVIYRLKTIIESKYNGISVYTKTLTNGYGEAIILEATDDI